MKKKFFFKFFLFTVLATLVTFTACKDYDDDIDDLQNQITNLSSVKTDLDGVKADIASALAKANEALTKAEAAGDAEAIKAAKDAADKAQKAADDLLPKIEELEAAIDAMDNASQEDLDALVVEIDGLREQFAEITGSGLLNFVLIPDYVFKDGATGIALFNQLNAGECGMIAAPTTLRYRVSPTNASEDMIDAEGIRFEFNAPKTRAEEAPKFTAEFVSLKDGVLTVKAHMATDALKGLNTGDGVEGDVVQPQIQLIVAAASGEEVITDWVSVQTETIGDDLYIANSQFEELRDEVFEWNDYKFPVTLDDAKDLDVEDALSVVEIQYDQSFDLINVVNALFGADEKLNLEDYGLTYNFDLKYTDGEEEKDIEYLLTENKTNQQDFIRLSDEAKGTVKSRVYSKEDSRTAIGRTPIVRVQLMNDDCVVKTAYIKINWVEEAKEPVPALEVEMDVTKPFTCSSIVLDEEVTVDWMNENIYSYFDMTKEEFHNAYDLVYLVDAFDAEGNKLPKGGNTYEKKDEGTEATHLFKWFFNPSDNGITPESNVVTGHINYVEEGTDKVAVTIKVTLTIEFPEFSLYGLDTGLWNADLNVFTVNPQVYKSITAGDEVNVFANLLRGFINKNDATPVDLIDMIKLPEGGVAPESVEFVFDEDKLSEYKYFIGDTEYSVAEGNLELESPTKLNLGNLRAATIIGKEIKLYNDGETATPEAKALIGQKVPVKVVVDQCGDGKVLSSVKEFEVFFIDPMTINADVKDNFKDAVINGSRIKVVDALTFTDWQGELVKLPLEPPTDLAEELGKYYGLQTPVWDTDNATSNLKNVGGNLVPTDGVEDGPLAGLEYRIEVEGDELVFYNDGEKLINSFVIYVPVSVDHKWGTVTDRIAITVKP